MIFIFIDIQAGSTERTKSGECSVGQKVTESLKSDKARYSNGYLAFIWNIENVYYKLVNGQFQASEEENT